MWKKFERIGESVIYICKQWALFNEIATDNLKTHLIIKQSNVNISYLGI